jgi:hypothetical protein
MSKSEDKTFSILKCIIVVEQVRQGLTEEELLETLNIRKASIKSKAFHERPALKGMIEFDPNLVEWKIAEGPKGPFELCKTDNESVEAFLILLLENKRAMLLEDGYLYWIMGDDVTIARKKLEVREDDQST